MVAKKQKTKLVFSDNPVWAPKRHFKKQTKKITSDLFKHTFLPPKPLF